MERLVEFPLEDGGSVLVEVADRGPVLRGGERPGGVVERAGQTLESAVGRVRPAVQVVVAQLRDLAQPPDEVCVTFGVELSAEAGAFVTSASTAANFTVSLTWHRDGSPG